MPELPEVETLASDLRRAGLKGRKIKRLTVRWPRTLDRPSAEEARLRLQDAQIEAVRRRGKYLILDLSTEDSLLVHLRMTGQLDIQPASTPIDERHHHLLIDLDDGNQLRFSRYA